MLHFQCAAMGISPVFVQTFQVTHLYMIFFFFLSGGTDQMFYTKV